MSTLFSHFLSKNNEIRPQEAVFTEVLSSIALTPKRLYFYGKMPAGSGLTGGGRSAENGDFEPGFGGSERGSEPAAGSAVRLSAGPSVRPKVLAIVGTRKPTKYGEEVAYKLGYEAAKRGAVVVSGLAFGIDAVAHRAALDAGGVTVAVLGTPIDYIYPRAHERLAAEIIERGGCIMSELAPGAKFQPKTCFLARNRLISGLADVVMIPEAAERSGSLNTAAHALEQGREIFAAPGDITRPMSMGCNRLIRQGATPYLGPEDILNILFPVPKRRRKMRQAGLFGDTEVETAILQLLAAGVRQGEEVLTKAGLSAAVFNQNMTMLEIKGRVRGLGMNRWELVG